MSASFHYVKLFSADDRSGLCGAFVLFTISPEWQTHKSKVGDKTCFPCVRSSKRRSQKQNNSLFYFVFLYFSSFSPHFSIQILFPCFSLFQSVSLLNDISRYPHRLLIAYHSFSLWKSLRIYRCFYLCCQNLFLSFVFLVNSFIITFLFFTFLFISLFDF